MDARLTQRDHHDHRRCQTNWLRLIIHITVRAKRRQFGEKRPGKVRSAVGKAAKDESSLEASLPPSNRELNHYTISPDTVRKLGSNETVHPFTNLVTHAAEDC